MISSFQDLEIYKESKRLFKMVSDLSEKIPVNGNYLKNQLLRAANSVHANMAEGYGRSVAEFKLYLTRSLGSNNEVISHLEDAEVSKLLPKEKTDDLINSYTTLGKRIYRLRENWQKFS